MTPAVSVRNLTKVYPIPFRQRSVVAIRDLNLEVETGQVYGLFGPNGSGKSTTLKIILGLISPTRGTAQVFGCDTAEVASRAMVGFLPENPYFYKYLTGAETLRFFGRLSGLNGTILSRRINHLLNLVGLTEAGDRRLRTYSKGMLQRIGLAQALVHDPQLLVLDEPTAGVDPAGSRQICELILQLKARGITILLSSHLLAQAEEICDRVGILAKGSLIREGFLHDLISQPNRTEVILENASETVLDELEKTAAKSGARLVCRRKAATSLEQLFLEATGGEHKRE